MVRFVIAALVAQFALGGMAFAQDAAHLANAARASEAIVSATTPALSGEFARQLSERFQTIDGVTSEQQQRLTAFLQTLPALVQSAMEERWAPPPPRTLSPAAQAFLDRSLANSIAGQRGEIGTARPPMREVVAAALAERYSPEHLSDIADFVTSPAGQAMSGRVAVAALRRETPAPSDFSAEHNAVISAFSNTTSGAAYFESAAWLTGIVTEQARLNIMTHGEEIMTEVLIGICEIVPEECPT